MNRSRSPVLIDGRLTRRRALTLGAGAAAVAGLAAAHVGAATGTPAAAAQSSVLAQGLLPDNRLLLYYGFPGNPNMGILGTDTPENLLGKMQDEMQNYTNADGSRPWKLGFELIASVAQGSPGEDNLYVADTDKKWLDEYTRFTSENDMVLFLDVQMGRKKPHDDYSGLEPWLAEDHVHLGIDPEFHMAADEIPGEQFGQVDGQDVTDAQNWLVGLAKKHNTTRKVLIVHQFRVDMITNKDKVKPVDNVDLVIDEDGFGTPDMKATTYDVMITQAPIEYNGIKLFYDQDQPLMTAGQTLAFDPEPDVVIYQ